MDRPIIQDQSQGRDYDVLWGWREALFGLGQAVLDLLGSSSTVIAGLAATPTSPTSLTINLAAGDIYQFADVDATEYGSLAADTNETIQQGFAAAQSVTLSTSGLTTGQSRWALIQASFSQTDVIPSDDPTGGLLAYLNANNPSGPPWSGPNNDGSTQPTRRTSVATISVIYGTAATTGSEVPPNPSANNVPLYLIDLAYGQTAITSGQILVAGPSVGTNVPSNYTQAPFLAGLLNSHHSGGAGQAPKIKLASEVQGILPYANMSATRIVASGNLTFYVNGSSGNDSNNGSSGAPWATIQHALNYITAFYDLANNLCTINVAAGTYAPFTLNGVGLGFGNNSGQPGLIINGASASSVIINDTSNNAVTVDLPGSGITLQNVTVQSSANAGLYCSAGIIYGTNVIFGACNAAAVQAEGLGQIYLNGYQVAGNAARILYANDNGYINVAGTNTVSGSVTVSTAYANANAGGVINATQATFSNLSSVTGSQYLANGNGVINIGAVTLPGTSGGTKTNGGQQI